MLSMLSQPLVTFVREIFMDQDLVTISPAAQALLDELEAIGRAKGEAEGERGALLTVLEARGFAVDNATRERVAQCSDTQTLKRWIARAVTSETLEKVLGDER